LDEHFRQLGGGSRRCTGILPTEAVTLRQHVAAKDRYEAVVLVHVNSYVIRVVVAVAGSYETVVVVAVAG
jgi:hypothetical protein